MIMDTVKTYTGQRGPAVWVLWACLFVGAVGLLVQLGMGMIVSWQGILFGIPLAIVQAAILVGVLRMTPLWRGVPPEHPSQLGWRVMGAAILWGAGVAVIVVPLVANPMKDLVSALRWLPLEASLAGAWPEEFIKALGIVIILMSFPHLTRPWQGLLIGALVGLGFDVQENLMYGYVEGLAHPDSDAMGMASTWLMRVVAGPYLHACWSALMGWGLGLAFFGLRNARGEGANDGETAGESASAAGRRPSARLWPAANWMIAALAMHFIWNLRIENSLLALASLVIIAICSYGLVVTVIVQQSRWLKAHPENVPVSVAA